VGQYVSFTLGCSDYLDGFSRDEAKAHAAAANQFLFSQFVTQSDLGSWSLTYEVN
jgi:hypothetical protein